MVLTTGMAMLGVLVMIVWACRAVIVCNDIEDADLVGSGVPRLFQSMCNTKQGSGGQIKEKHRNDKRKNNSIF